MKGTFTIGCDPELFLKSPQGELVSAVGLIGGTKWAPLPISKDGHAIQEDNVSVEYNIPPCSNAEDFIKHNLFVLSHLKERASELGLEFAVNVAAASFDPFHLNTPEAKTFGCEPDYNAWTKKVNPRPMCNDENLRSCGGHVHVGTELDHCSVVRAMDLFLGVPSIFLDSDVLRRQLYGKAGAFRSKPYGPEYRTLSNFWIWGEDRMKWVYNQTQKALEFVEEGNEISAYHGTLIRQSINNGNTKAAEALGRQYKGIFV
jgi:hypothetical protein